MLTLMLMGILGVSVERCSCTGRISLTIPTDTDCCAGGNSCMTLKTLHLSDYIPAMTAHVDMPMQPCLFTLFSPSAVKPQAVAASHGWPFCAEAPPGRLANSVTVLRV